MAVFSVNQARHLYVAKEVKTPHVVSADAAGSIAVRTNKEKSHLYFEYKSADNLVRSDLIDVKNIMYAKATDAKDMQRELKAVTVTLDNTVNGGSPVGGEDYILRIAFRQFVGMSDEDTYIKYGMVHAYNNMSASDFYKELAKSLVKNFSRELTPLVKFTLAEGEEAVPVDVNTKWDTLKGNYTALVIDEVEQPWVLGTMAQVPVYFDVYPTTITVDGDERIWGVVEDTESEGYVGNGKNIADLEYFCMGERGDIYRNIGWPNVITTTYLVDPSKEYYTLDIHYAYVGANEGVQKSEKDITIVSANKATINSIISAVNTATGLTIASIA
jgi:hypothetical protein